MLTINSGDARVKETCLIFRQSDLQIQPFSTDTEENFRIHFGAVGKSLLKSQESIKIPSATYPR